MTKSQNLKFDAIENTDAIVGIDIAKNVHWAGIILPNGKEIKKSFSFHNNKKGIESLVETVKNVLTMLNFKKAIIGMEPTGNYLKSFARYLIRAISIKFSNSSGIFPNLSIISSITFCMSSSFLHSAMF